MLRYVALASDYDGTIARDGIVAEHVHAALQRVRESGRRVVLVTGRRLEELAAVFPHLELFDRIVAENGATLYRPKMKEVAVLAPPPPRAFVDALLAHGIPLDVGHVIVATREPHETLVLDTIREQGLEMQVIFNKGAVMVLPSGVNKATGLDAALSELGVSWHSVVGVGDAENDHAFLSRCECSFAVADALPAVRERCDVVTAGGAGDGVAELAEALLRSDLAELEERVARHRVAVGTDGDGHEVELGPYGETVLVAGPEGSGKSTIATGLLERLADAGYQFCLLDPEGDHEGLPAVVLGDAKREPTCDEIVEVLARPDQSAVANLSGLERERRPPYLLTLLARLQDLRTRFARPHWIALDDVHRVLTSSWEGSELDRSLVLPGMLLISDDPDAISPVALAALTAVVALGEKAGEVLARVARAAGWPALEEAAPARPGEALFARRGEPVVRVRVDRPRAERRRHRRKYAEGDLGPDASFYFRGADGRLNLRAQNLSLFLQLADGVDVETWNHHRRLGEYSRWVREAIRDEALANEIAAVERDPSLSAQDARARVKQAIERFYAVPAG
ncbi:MAG TPA: HAD family hydrolase [Candidatus Binatia bacterium]|nr:HAD family hydrolase [Candidatus Binatia bacterium]